MKGKKGFIGIAVICLLLASLWVASDAAAQEKLVAYYSPPAGGGAFTLVAGQVTVTNRYMGAGYKFVHEQTTGTLEIVRRMAVAQSQKKDAFGDFGSTDGYNAYKGRAEYAGKPFPGLRSIAYNQLVDLYLAVPANSPIKTYADVKGKRIGMGGPGSSVANTGLLILAQYGVKKEDFKPYYFVYKESIEGLQDGSLDGALFAGGYPMPSYLELATRNNVRIIPVDEKVANKIIADQPGYYTGVVKAKSYKGLDQDTRILGWTGTIWTHSGVSDDLVYKFIKNLYDHKEEYYAVHQDAKELKLQEYNKGVAVPFHPGAEKYFKEVGVWKQPSK
jgi:TRAP transporter TAXI family solute receptor